MPLQNSQTELPLIWRTKGRKQRRAEICTVVLSNFTCFLLYFVSLAFRADQTTRSFFFQPPITSRLGSINGLLTPKTPAVRVQRWETAINSIKQRFSFFPFFSRLSKCSSYHLLQTLPVWLQKPHDKYISTAAAKTPQTIAAAGPYSSRIAACSPSPRRNCMQKPLSYGSMLIIFWGWAFEVIVELSDNVWRQKGNPLAAATAAASPL